MLRILAIGAHPDDCDYRVGGTAALWAQLGHAVKFVSLTNGDAGHHEIHGETLAARRREEANEAGRRLGVAYDVLYNHDGELQPTLDLRREVIRQIRGWQADIVIGPRPHDYHPDHRYTAQAMQDAAYLVMVPAVVPDVAPLRSNPVFLYHQDRFERPYRFHPDIAVIIDETIDLKIDALDAHVSQFYEWLPWVEGHADEVPADPAERKQWLKRQRTPAISPAIRESLKKWYGEARAAEASQAEAFEICEYGARPDDQRIRELFPMLPGV